jgi:hypothetical protein
MISGKNRVGRRGGGGGDRGNIYTVQPVEQVHPKGLVSGNKIQLCLTHSTELSNTLFLFTFTRERRQTAEMQA